MKVEMRKERRWTFRARGCTICLHRYHFLHKHVRSHIEMVAFVLDIICGHCAQEHGKMHIACHDIGCACPCKNQDTE